MGSYAQWRVAADRGEVRRVTWLCGDQRVLIEEVVTTIRGLLQVNDLDHVTITASPASVQQIWAAANQYPLTPGANRLIVIRDADTITSWTPLYRWMAATRTLPGVYLLLVSNATDLPHTPAEGRRRGTLAPHVEQIQTKRRLGQTIRCTQPSETDAIAWVRRRCQLDTEIAAYLLGRCRGELSTAAAVCAQLALFDTATLGRATIDQLCPLAPPDSFSDALIAGDKPQALAALAALAEQERGACLALLASRLDLLAALWKATRAGQGAHEITGLPAYLVRQYLPHAKRFDPQRCAYIRQVLAVVDDAHRSGARVGVLEMLVALM